MLLEERDYGKEESTPSSFKEINWKKVGKYAAIGGLVIGSLAAIVGAGMAVFGKAPEVTDAPELEVLEETPALEEAQETGV